MAGKTNKPRGILTAAALLALGVSGCVQRTASADAAPPPRMPQILPAKPTAAAPAVSQADILATALRRANDGDIPGALRLLDAIEDRAEGSASRREFVASLANDDPSRAVQVVLAPKPNRGRNLDRSDYYPTGPEAGAVARLAAVNDSFSLASSGV